MAAASSGMRPVKGAAMGRPVSLMTVMSRSGVSAEMRAACTGTFAVPMRGMVESLNVSVAAGIALHAVTKDRPGDLGEREVRALRARFLMESVRSPELVIERWRKTRGLP